MKPPTVFLGEMSNGEVEQFLEKNHTVIVPTGSTEQHGPHLALATDVLIPQEVARRVASKLGAVVAPPISYALSYPHHKFTVESHAVHTAFFFSAPGSVYDATKSGTWGDARQATREMGEEYLKIAVDATLAVLDNIERTFLAMPPR